MKQYFEAGSYKLFIMYNGASLEAISTQDMWINQDQIVRCMINNETKERTLILSNGDRVIYKEEDPF